MIGRVLRDDVFRLWMVINVVIITAFLLSSCGSSGGSKAPKTPTPVELSETVTVYEDNARGVVCYFVRAGQSDGGVAIDCLELTP